MNPRRRLIFLIAAAVLIAAAFLWSVHLDQTGQGAKLLRTLNAYGYALQIDDLYPAGAWKDTSIRALLPDSELKDAVQASRDAGFPSDIDKAGDVTLLLAHTESADVLTVYLVGDTPELCFVQGTGTGEIRALGK